MAIVIGQDKDDYDDDDDDDDDNDDDDDDDDEEEEEEEEEKEQGWGIGWGGWSVGWEEGGWRGGGCDFESSLWQILEITNVWSSVVSFNTKVSYQHGYSHYIEKKNARPSYLYIESPYNSGADNCICQKNRSNYDTSNRFGTNTL